jgi:methylglutaconyl-CoA hydratase
MITGRTFDSEEARSAGLVHYICEEGSLEDTTGRIVNEICSGGPEAIKGVKKLLRKLEPGRISEEVQEYTAEIIARFRVSEEGQEGISSFFEKRKPRWHENP